MRRDRNAGTLTETSPGTWRLRAFLGTDPETGHARQASRTVHTPKRGGKTQALAELKRFVAEIEEDNPGVGQASTFGKLLDEWLAHLPRQGKAPNTIASYASAVKVHIRPGLGHIRLGNLKAHDLDEFYRMLQEEKELKPSSIQLVHGVISAALNQAIDWEWIRDSPARRAHPPTAKREDPRAPTVDAVQRLYSAALAEDPDMAVAIALAARMGARRGELCGLQWGDVNWTARTLHIERSIVPGQGGQHLRPTKTKTDRTIHLDDGVIGLLIAYRKTKAEQFPEVELEPASWLISPDGGRTPMRAKSLTEYLSSLGKRLDPPVTIHLHETRHFAATQLFALGVDPATVAAILGHSKASMTLDVYTHTDDERGAAAIAMLSNLLAVTSQDAKSAPSSAPEES